MNIHLILAVFLAIFSTCTPALSAPVPTYVAEFSVSGASKPEEMKTTLQTLLLSRLAGENIATQIKPEGAEIKVIGSYLLSGGFFSLDAAAVNSNGAVIARAFSQGSHPDELIPAVGALAKSLSEGIKKGTSLAGAPRIAALPTEIVKPARTIAAAGLTAHKMEGALSGLAVGRTFPGGERELFAVGSHTLRYYRQGAELKLMMEIPYKVHEKVLAVDTADLDNDKELEVYVTIMNGEILASQVWVVDGSGLKKIAGSLPYFFRTVTDAGGVKKLYAQQISGTADFYGDVSEVVRSGENYALKNPIKLPKPGYLYNFSMLKGLKGEPNLIITDRSGYLRVFNPLGDELWKSSDEYGGSETFFQRTDFGGSRRNGDRDRQVFLDQRVVVKGNNELLVAKNTASWFMLSKHSYSNSSLYSFVWNGSELEEQWHTKQSDFYLADFAYDDSRRELLMLEVVAKEEGIFDKGASRLVVRKLD